MKSDDQFIAASIGDIDWLKQCIYKGRIKFDKNGLAALHLAAMHVHLDCIKLLIEKYEFNVDLTTQNGSTALQLAINKKLGNRSRYCVNYLLEKGANPSLSNYEGTTALHQAASEGYLTVIKVLIEWGARLDCKDNNGYLPLDCAQLCGHEKCFRIMGAAMWNKDKDLIAAQIRQLHQIKYKLQHFKNRKINENQKEKKKDSKPKQEGISWQKDVSWKSRMKTSNMQFIKQADKTPLTNKEMKKKEIWIPFTRGWPDKYMPKLSDKYPRDPYTLMPKSQIENKYFDGKHRCACSGTCSPTILTMDELYHFQLPDLPTDIIAKELAPDPTLFERPQVFKCKNILDVPAKGKPSYLPKNEIYLHLSTDKSSFVFQNSLQPNTKMMLVQKRNNSCNLNRPSSLKKE